jgi:hypothetical protein
MSSCELGWVDDLVLRRDKSRACRQAGMRDFPSFENVSAKTRSHPAAGLGTYCIYCSWTQGLGLGLSLSYQCSVRGILLAY